MREFGEKIGVSHARISLLQRTEVGNSQQKKFLFGKKLKVDADIFEEIPEDE
jgi:hypothetical protein